MDQQEKDFISSETKELEYILYFLASDRVLERVCLERRLKELKEKLEMIDWTTKAHDELKNKITDPMYKVEIMFPGEKIKFISVCSDELEIHIMDAGDGYFDIQRCGYTNILKYDYGMRRKIWFANLSDTVKECIEEELDKRVLSKLEQVAAEFYYKISTVTHLPRRFVIENDTDEFIIDYTSDGNCKIEHIIKESDESYAIYPKIGVSKLYETLVKYIKSLLGIKAYKEFIEKENSVESERDYLSEAYSQLKKSLDDLKYNIVPSRNNRDSIFVYWNDGGNHYAIAIEHVSDGNFDITFLGKHAWETVGNKISLSKLSGTVQNYIKSINNEYSTTKRAYLAEAASRLRQKLGNVYRISEDDELDDIIIEWGDEALQVVHMGGGVFDINEKADDDWLEVDFDVELDELAGVVSEYIVHLGELKKGFEEVLDDLPRNLNSYSREAHAANEKWWVDANGNKIERNRGELLMLMVSEISEAMEGERKDLMDDKLPHRKMAEVELADALIRIFDYAGAFGYDLEGAYQEKMAYNKTRADHSHEARSKEGGKKW